MGYTQPTKEQLNGLNLTKTNAIWFGPFVIIISDSDRSRRDLSESEIQIKIEPYLKVALLF